MMMFYVIGMSIPETTLPIAVSFPISTELGSAFERVSGPRGEEEERTRHLSTGARCVACGAVTCFIATILSVHEWKESATI